VWFSSEKLLPSIFTDVRASHWISLSRMRCFIYQSRNEAWDSQANSMCWFSCISSKHPWCSWIIGFRYWWKWANANGRSRAMRLKRTRAAIYSQRGVKKAEHLSKRTCWLWGKQDGPFKRAKPTHLTMVSQQIRKSEMDLNGGRKG